MDKTALSYWFPKIEAASLPVPKTRIIPITPEAETEIWGAFDGIKQGNAKPFFNSLEIAANEMGYPCFLRTDQTSGKHSWERTCFLESPKDIPQHVFNIAEFSELADLRGLSWTMWVIRELLPTIPYGICPDFGNFPICKEFRFFVEDETIKCFHPYWPLFCLEDGGAAQSLDYDALCRMDNEAELASLASQAGKVVGGAWSVDVLETRKGWYITDMAEAARSYHWKGCKAAELLRRVEG
jgi:hypothetical protein